MMTSFADRGPVGCWFDNLDEGKKIEATEIGVIETRRYGYGYAYGSGNGNGYG